MQKVLSFTVCGLVNLFGLEPHVDGSHAVLIGLMIRMFRLFQFEP